MHIKVNRNRIYDEMELVVVLNSAANTGVVNGSAVVRAADPPSLVEPRFDHGLLQEARRWEGTAQGLLAFRGGVFSRAICARGLAVARCGAAGFSRGGVLARDCGKAGRAQGVNRGNFL